MSDISFTTVTFYNDHILTVRLSYAST